MKHLSLKVGDGTWIKFWDDICCGDSPLRQSFPYLFRLVQAPEAMVEENMRFQGSTSF